ncbi:MAG: BamA/TamA family outer membrane protein [Bacteroidota bacterium]
MGYVSAGQETGSRFVHDSLTTIADCPQKDIFDILSKKKVIDPTIPSRKVRAIILPLIGLSPTTGFQFGAGASLSWPMGHNPATKLSAGSGQVLWTTKRQLIVLVRSNIFLDRNKWFIQTDWRWYFFRLPTYGLGTGPKTYDPNIPVDPADEESYDNNGRYLMKFNWVRLHNILFREVSGHFFAGLGYHLDHYYNIVDADLNLDTAHFVMTPHYAYSLVHNFNPDTYTTSGISLNFAYDTRDNIINAYKGVYVNINYLYNFSFLGSSRNGSRLWTEFRTYVGLSRMIPRHLLAFWAYGCFKVSGDLPYLNLMSNGFDQMNASGRGYAQGRWRGEDFVYGEMEYRFPISPCSRIVGGVLFANVSSASSRDQHVPLFGFFKPGCGFGFRIMVGKHDRTNLLIDFGLGQLSQGFYLQAQEIF